MTDRHMSPLESLAQRRRRYTAQLHPEVVTDLYERVNSGAISIELATLIADVLGPGDWREQAACKGMDPSWWFPEGQGAPGVAKARRVCNGCTVRQQCFEYAEEAPELDGIWGGYGTVSRRRSKNRTPYTAPTTVCVDCGTPLDSRTLARCSPCTEKSRLDAHRRNALSRYSRDVYDGHKRVAS